jgi:hypothetical protein
MSVAFTTSGQFQCRQDCESDNCLEKKKAQINLNANRSAKARAGHGLGECWHLPGTVEL